MKLKEEGLKNRAQWERAGYELPRFDRKAVKEATKESPFWIHFGVGNLFRAYQANAVQKLLNDGVIDRGLIAAEGFDYEIVEKMSRLHDDYSILVTLKSDGEVKKTVVGSVMESLALDSENEEDFGRLKKIFEKDSLQMVSFTITEKGYSLVDGKGETLADVKSDFEHGPQKPKSYMGKVASLLYARYQSGQKPVAMVSMDNCSHNGDKLFGAIAAFADHWKDQGFLSYINDRKKVTFPWTMIDKITPRPDSSVEEILRNDGVEEVSPVITSKNSYAAPFVNAEECEYLVIEDAFPNGRPELEKSGFLFASREIVEQVEKMKVCTCLNPLHTALAIFGCLLGYKLISAEMKDKTLCRLVERIGYVEGLPVVVNPKIIDPKEFIDAVLRIRMPNPFMPDTPQRIATDTSQKLAVRFGETIKAYQRSDGGKVKDLTGILLVFAGWLRYLKGMDDQWTEFTLSPDPLLDEVCPYVKKTQLGSLTPKQELLPVLSDVKIFGVDLEQIGMADQVCTYYNEMCTKRGAVRKTLEKYLL